jgi:catechol 2,3-dioxygenase-like lactoylglutathione lyase family enzyme
MKQGSMQAIRFLTLVAVFSAVGSVVHASPPIVESKFELFVTNVDESVRFYTTLGFVVAQRKADGYTTLRSGSTVIALSPVPSWLPLRWISFLRHPPLGVEIVLYSDRVEELRSALDSAGYAPGEIELQAWDDRDFRVTDHDGYYVRVSEGRAIPASE